MKSIFTILLLFCASFLMAQNIGFPYSTTIRDANGLAVTSTSVTATATIRPVGGGTAVYSETHIVTTDANGLLSIVVGEGTATSGNTLADVDWGVASYEINVTAGSTDTTFPIYSAPTALYSVESGSGGGSSTPGAIFGKYKQLTGGGTYNIQADDYALVSFGAAGRTFNLGSGAAQQGRIIRIINQGSASVTVTASTGGLYLINGAQIGTISMNAGSQRTFIARQDGWTQID